MTRPMLEDTFKKSIDLQSYTWKHRRRFAYMAFFTMLVSTALCFFWVDVERLQKLDTIVTWLYMTCGTIVCTYMGASTYASVTGDQSGMVMGQDSYQAANEAMTDENDDDGFFVQPEAPRAANGQAIIVKAPAE